MGKAISILGCTGSIGRQTIAVAEHIGMPVAALTANRKIDMLEQQARKLKPKFVAVYDEAAAKQFKLSVADRLYKVRDYAASEALVRISRSREALEEYDTILKDIKNLKQIKRSIQR